MKNTNARIFILCPCSEILSGGVKQIYRHVDILNQNGFQAFVLHKKLGFRCSWFENTTQIAYKANIRNYSGNHDRTWHALLRRWKRALFTPLWKKIYSSLYQCGALMTRNQGGVLIKQFEKTDYLVIPEFYGLDIADFEPGIPKIIFNQGAYLTFGGYSLDKNDLNTPYLSNEVIAAMVISQDSYEYLTYVFPQLNLVRLYNGIDSGMFKYTSEKKKQIAFMPRKLPKEITQVINILKYRGALQGFELVAIANKDEEEVAKILQESLIFLSTGTQEGFSLPPAEAMACGCIVVGYHGNGGKEFFKEEFCYPIQATDIITFAKTVESVIHEYEKDQTPILRKGQKASEFIKKTYSLHKEEEAIVGFWERICGIPS